MCDRVAARGAYGRPDGQGRRHFARYRLSMDAGGPRSIFLYRKGSTGCAIGECPISDGRARMVGYPGPEWAARRGGAHAQLRLYRDAANTSVARADRERDLYAVAGRDRA